MRNHTHPTAAKAKAEAGLAAGPLPADPAEGAAILAVRRPASFTAKVLASPPNTVLSWRRRFWPDRERGSPWTVADILTADLALALSSAGLNVTDSFTVARTAERELGIWQHVLTNDPEPILLALRPPGRTPVGLWGCSLHRASAPPVHQGEVELICDVSSIARAMMVRVATEMRRENEEGGAYGTA